MPRAALFHGAGQPMQPTDFSLPPLAEGEVLVQVVACTLCRSDLHTYFGRRKEPIPIVLGHEIVGRIEAFGPGANRLDARGRPASIGSRITWPIVVGCGQCPLCLRDLPQKCERLYKYGHQSCDLRRMTGGGLADRMVLVSGTRWLLLPETIPDDVAAMANCAFATVAGLLRLAGREPDRSVLVLGAGVLGLAACAMFRAAGARRVIAVDRAETSRRASLRFGATHSLDSDDERLSDEILRITEGRGVEVAMELAGASSLVATAVECAAIGGQVLLAGTVSPGPSVPLDPEQVVRRLLTIRGLHNYHPDDLRSAIDFLAGPGQAYPWSELIDRSFNLEQIDDAFRHGESIPGRRVVIHPGG